MSSAPKLDLPRSAHPWLPPWVPKGPPQEWNVTKVVNHAKTAMLVELTTIPLYLYAAYSIDVNPDDYSATAQKEIIGVVLQEMLHLALSGNLVCALDGFMALYDFPIIPQFPGAILYEKIELNLNRADQENLTLFMEVEAPDTSNHTSSFFKDKAGSESAPGLVPGYRSIGDFYENLKKGLATLSDDHLNNNPDYQFAPQDFFSGKGMVVITDQPIAQNALEFIVEQGEGGAEVQSGSSHYAIFSSLCAEPPWKLYNVPKNPKTRDYKGRGSPIDFAYTLSLAFDAGYCYLLQTIQRVWGRGGGGVFLHNHLVGNMTGIMKTALPGIANILVHQRLSPKHRGVAAPCFNYYPLNDDGEPGTPLEPEDLHSEFVRLVREAAGIAREFQLTLLSLKLTEMAVDIEELTPRP